MDKHSEPPLLSPQSDRIRARTLITLAPAAALLLLWLLMLSSNPPADISIGAILAIFAAGSLLYLIPGIVAARRDHPQWLPIFLVDLLLGWSLIGWVASLVWALITPGEPVAPQITIEAEKPDVAAQLARLADLHRGGVLNDAEFAVAKAQLLA